jgi:hypothetical protein
MGDTGERTVRDTAGRCEMQSAVPKIGP